MIDALKNWLSDHEKAARADFLERTACEMIGGLARLVRTIELEMGAGEGKSPYIVDNNDGSFTTYDIEGNRMHRYKVKLIED